MKAIHRTCVAFALMMSIVGCSKGPTTPEVSATKASKPPPEAAKQAPPQARALSGQWHSAGDLPIAFERPVALELSDGSVFVYGNGEDARGALWDPAANTWRPSPASKRPRGEAAASILADGKVLITGGVHIPKGHYVLRSSEIYDPSTKRWKDAGSTGEQRRGHSHLSLSDGRVLIIGGVGGGFAAPTRDISLYDPKTSRYSSVAQLGVGRSFHAVTDLGGDAFMVVGGQDKEGPLKSIELCKVGQKRCRVVPRPMPRERAALMRLKSGDILISGGNTRRAGAASEVLYDPGKGEFQPTGAMQKARNDHSLTLLGDGRVLAVGGEKSAASSAEVYDPKANAWASAPAPEQGRHGHAALRLRDGSVLIVGGVDANGKAVLGAERLKLGR